MATEFIRPLPCREVVGQSRHPVMVSLGAVVSGWATESGSPLLGDVLLDKVAAVESVLVLVISFSLAVPGTAAKLTRSLGKLANVVQQPG
jgi:hypothetical protein